MPQIYPPSERITGYRIVNQRIEVFNSQFIELFFVFLIKYFLKDIFKRVVIDF